MIPLRYHGYPDPSLLTPDIMRKLADDQLVYAQMDNTFEPLLIDVVSKSRYAVPHEVDGLIDMISFENRKHRYQEMSKR